MAHGRLIAKGLLPPEVVYAHPGFLLPCVNVGQQEIVICPLYAADLSCARRQYWVIGDRAQAPSGSGYALENRIVLSRVLPSLYRDSHVHRVALFFRALRSTLHALAPQRRDNPRIVLLTPGPGNETYFEHSYLADYLGFLLVQGRDLTVRDGRVWLSTVDGLQPVDVILRRVDDTFCDPLELRAGFVAWAPGLFQAARLGHVAIVNPLGSGVLENPALMAFLPTLVASAIRSRSTPPFGGDVVVWWGSGTSVRTRASRPLGDQADFSASQLGDHLWRRLEHGTSDKWSAERITAQPHLFVGQEQVALSTTPVLTRMAI